MRIVGLILRIYSYIFEFLLSLVLLLLGIFGAANGNTLDLAMTPWKGAQLTHWLTGLGLIGIVCTVLTITGWLRYLFPLWTLFIFIMIVRGYYISPYTFSGSESFKPVLWFTLAAFIAFLGSLTVFAMGGKTRKPLRS